MSLLVRRAASALTQRTQRGMQSGVAAAVSCTRITQSQAPRQTFAAPAFSSSVAARAPTAAATAPASASAAASSPQSSLSKFTSIPVIDLSGTFGTGPDVAARRAAVAKLIDQAAREVGFFTIVGHGLDERMVADVWKITQAYFDLPVETKNKILMDKEYPYGYSGFGGESLAKGYNGEAARPDPKECFAIGPYDPRAGMTAVRWPAEPKEFQQLWLTYYKNMEGLAGHLLSLFAQALELPQDWFAGKIDRHRSALRALNYPKLDRALKAGEVRAGAHTDYGSLTILLQDSTGGLQVRNRAKQWVDATPRANSFVINLGDLMARWSNDRWVSTLHRVVQPPQAALAPPARRQSMAFFHNVNHDQMIECIPTCASQSNPPKYEPIAAWDLLMQKHLSATTY